MRVLLVEDNDDDVLLIQESLSEMKISIARAARLSTALEQLAKGGFDAVLLDLSLRDSRGAPQADPKTGSNRCILTTSIAPMSVIA